MCKNVVILYLRIGAGFVDTTMQKTPDFEICEKGCHCLFLGSPLWFVAITAPVVLSLSHFMSLSDRLGPVLGNISSSLKVERSVILEDSSLLDIPFVVSLFLLLLIFT